MVIRQNYDYFTVRVCIKFYQASSSSLLSHERNQFHFFFFFLELSLINWCVNKERLESKKKKKEKKRRKYFVHFTFVSSRKKVSTDLSEIRCFSYSVSSVINWSSCTIRFPLFVSKNIANVPLLPLKWSSNKQSVNPQFESKLFKIWRLNLYSATIFRFLECVPWLPFKSKMINK